MRQIGNSSNKLIQTRNLKLKLNVETLEFLKFQPSNVITNNIRLSRTADGKQLETLIPVVEGDRDTKLYVEACEGNIRKLALVMAGTVMQRQSVHKSLVK